MSRNFIPNYISVPHHRPKSSTLLTRTLPILLLLATTARACEGPCINGITNAFVGNYSSLLDVLFNQAARQIQSAFSLPNHTPTSSSDLTRPLQDSYSQLALQSLETAIFPSYFHGKCVAPASDSGSQEKSPERNGQRPSTAAAPVVPIPGCPNPACPVVCGTPGSLVHFYPTLRYIVYTATKGLLQNVTMEGSDAFKKVLAIVEAARSKRGKRIRSDGVAPAPQAGALEKSAIQQFKPVPFPILHDGTPNLKSSSSSLSSDSKKLERILKTIPGNLPDVCGGTPDESEDALPMCSWEVRMKEYILTFP